MRKHNGKIKYVTRETFSKNIELRTTECLGTACDQTHLSDV